MTLDKLPIPWYKVFWAKLFNMVGEKHLFRIVATSSDYMELRLFFGLVEFEKGQKYEFIIRGTEKFAEIISNQLLTKGFKNPFPKKIN